MERESKREVSTKFFPSDLRESCRGGGKTGKARDDGEWEQGPLNQLSKEHIGLHQVLFVSIIVISLFLYGTLDCENSDSWNSSSCGAAMSNSNMTTLTYCWWQCKLVQPLSRWKFLKKITIELLYDPFIYHSAVDAKRSQSWHITETLCGHHYHSTSNSWTIE